MATAFTIFEAEAIRQFAEEYILQFKKAVETEKIKRVTPSKGGFVSVANASGKLANSGEWKFDGVHLDIAVNSYVRYIIFGRGARQGGEKNNNKPPFTEIEQWMKEKGISGVSPWAIINAIAKNGSSIFQQFRGQPSNLLDNIPLDEMINELAEKLLTDIGNNITTEVLNEYKLLDLQ